VLVLCIRPPPFQPLFTVQRQFSVGLPSSARQKLKTHVCSIKCVFLKFSTLNARRGELMHEVFLPVRDIEMPRHVASYQQST